MNHFILALRAYKSDVEIHKHSAFQIVLSEDHPFTSTCENITHANISGFVIKPQVAHSCQCSNSNLMVINIEPYSYLGKYLSGKLGEKRNAVFFNSQQEVNAFFQISQGRFTLNDLVEKGQAEFPQRIMDERVIKIIQYINDHCRSNKFTLDELSDIVFLSPSRLAYLFKLQTGSSISRYLLWTRVRNAVALLLAKDDKSITTIAQESGFYDSSQMNKYMYEMFGISPSRLKQKSDLIQFLN